MIFPSTLRRMIIAYNGNEGPEYFQAGDSLMYPGMVCMADDADEVKICITTGLPFGIIGCDADHDLGTVYAEGERIPVWILGCGVDIYVLCNDAATITVAFGSIMDTADDTTDAGMARVKDAFAEVTTSGTSTERNVGNSFWIGRALAAGSITATVKRYVPVKLSF